MKSEPIKVSKSIEIYQSITKTQDKMTWQLLLSKKGEEVLELEKNVLENHPMIGKNFELYEPKLINAFIKDNCLYAFVCREASVFFYEFNFFQNKKFSKKEQKIALFSAGSIDNFGGYVCSIDKFEIDKVNYFYLTYGRDVGPKFKQILSFNNARIKKIEFSDKKIKIKDEEQFFKTLDLDKNTEKVSAEIKKVLIESKLLDKINNFKYFGNIDLTNFHDDDLKLRTRGTIYLIYQDSHLRKKIICYDNYDSEWLIGDYKEEEIKQP